MENKSEEVKSTEVEKQPLLVDAIKKSIIESGEKEMDRWDNMLAYPGDDMEVHDGDREKRGRDAMVRETNTILREFFGVTDNPGVKNSIFSEMALAAAKDYVNRICLEGSNPKFDESQKPPVDSLPTTGVFR